MQLTNIKTVVLQAGHGQGDPGAIWNSAVENTEVNQIIPILETILRNYGVNVVVTPDLNLINSIRYINTHHNNSSDWIIEIHKDSAPSMAGRDVKRMGVYHYTGSTWSQQVAEVFKNYWINTDPVNQLRAWNRPDSAARFGRLGWIRDLIAPSHLIEAGFIQGFTGSESYQYYAEMIAKPILCLLGKDQNIDDNITENNNNNNNNNNMYGWNQNLQNNPNFEYYKNKADRNDKSLVSDIADRDDEIKELIEKFEELKKENALMRNELVTKDSEIESLRKEIENLGSRLQELDNKNYQIQERIEEIKSASQKQVDDAMSHFTRLLNKAKKEVADK